MSQKEEQEDLAIRVSEILEPKLKRFISESMKEHLADFIIRVVDKESRVFEELDSYITTGVSNVVEAYVDDNLDEEKMNEECSKSIQEVAANFDYDDIATEEISQIIRNEDFTQVIEKEVEHEVSRHCIETVMTEQINAELDDIPIKDLVEEKIEEKIDDELSYISIDAKVDVILEQKIEIRTAKQQEKIS